MLLLGAGAVSAHDFWLVPDAFQVASGDALLVKGQTGTQFPGSISAVTADRIADARILSATGEDPLREFSVVGKSLVIAHRPTTEGERVIVLSLQPRTSRQSAAGFKRYLALEGAADVVARYERNGTLPTDSVTMRAGKYAKTLVQVGAGGPRAFSRTAGHPLEFVPLTATATLRAGDTARVRVLFRGTPLAGAHVHAGVAPANESVPREPDASLMSDAAGIVLVPILRSGLWNLRTGFAAPTEGAVAGEWDVDWATFVFHTAPGHAGTSDGDVSLSRLHPSDSTAVASVVTAFRAAVVRGDSAAALALLAPDVRVLEAGGIEDLAEFRGHHLPADIAFARAVPSTTGPLHVTLAGSAAWVVSTSMTQGTFNGRTVNSVGAELVVLSKRADGRWQIRAIHWSSRRRP